MKKLKIVMLFVLLSLGVNAQTLSEGDALVSGSLGLAGSSVATGGGFSITVPPMLFSYEKMFTDKISAGGFVGLFGSKYAAYDYVVKYSFIYIGGVGNYHFYMDDNFDLYGGLRLGFYKASVSGNTGFYNAISTSGLAYSAHVGGRYFFSENFAALAELGLGISFLSVGVSMKL